VALHGDVQVLLDDRGAAGRADAQREGLPPPARAPAVGSEETRSYIARCATPALSWAPLAMPAGIQCPTWSANFFDGEPMPRK
jgi:hypothetical protein